MKGNYCNFYILLALRVIETKHGLLFSNFSLLTVIYQEFPNVILVVYLCEGNNLYTSCVIFWVGGDLKEYLVPTFLLWPRNMGKNKVHIQFNVKTFYNRDNTDKTNYSWSR